MEPVSAVASILGIATAAVQVSKALHGLLRDIKDAPGDIGRLSDDIQSISALLSSLENTLKDEAYRRVLENNKSIVRSLKHLKSPLKSCAKIIEKIKDKITPCLDLLGGGKGSKLSRTKWWWNKDATRNLIVTFESTKQTLNIHLANVSVYVHFRPSAILLCFHLLIAVQTVQPPRRCQRISTTFDKTGTDANRISRHRCWSCAEEIYSSGNHLLRRWQWWAVRKPY